MQQYGNSNEINREARLGRHSLWQYDSEAMQLIVDAI
jgi:hypothetical protein